MHTIRQHVHHLCPSSNILQRGEPPHPSGNGHGGTSDCISCLPVWRSGSAPSLLLFISFVSSSPACPRMHAHLLGRKAQATLNSSCPKTDCHGTEERWDVWLSTCKHQCTDMSPTPCNLDPVSSSLDATVEKSYSRSASKQQASFDRYSGNEIFVKQRFMRNCVLAPRKEQRHHTQATPLL